MKRAPRILVLGYNAWDASCSVVGEPRLDQKHEVQSIRCGGGGPGATAAVCLARLGADVKLVTVLGDDLPARAQESELLAAGIDISAAPRVMGAESPQALILVAKTGARTVFWSRGALPQLAADAVRTDWLDHQDLFYTDGHETAAARILATEARQRGVPVVMDAGSVRDGTAPLVAAASDVIGATGFASRLTGLEAPDAALRAMRELGPERVATTYGAGGVLALVEDRIVHVPAFAVEVIDTTGAGDAFHGGYAFARAGGQGFWDCLEVGCAVAALKCTAWGGRAGLPNIQAVRDLLATGERLPLPAELARFVTP